MQSTCAPHTQALLGTIQHPKGNISELLLAEGFARIMDSSFVDVRGDKARMRAAEDAAKARSLRMWKTYKAPTMDIPEADRKFTATTIEVINPERIKVKKANGDVLELGLSSIRQPRRPRDESDNKRERGGKNGKGAAPAAAAEDGGDGDAPAARRPKPL
jgi:staphylococcal nuclease domain-containing protein 1